MVYNASVSLKTPKNINLSKFVENFKLSSGFTSKRYITAEDGEIRSYYKPALVIPDGAQCSYELCKRKDLQSHITHCSTPQGKYLIFSEKGLVDHVRAITKYFNENDVPRNDRYKLLNGILPLGFNNVFKLNIKNESSLQNMVDLSFNNMSIQVTSSSSIHILHGNDDIDPKKLFLLIFPNTPISDINVLYTIRRHVHDIGKSIKIIELHGILSRDKQLHNYKYSDKFMRISFIRTIATQNMFFTINRTGKIQILLSPPKTRAGKVIPGKFSLSVSKAVKYISNMISAIPDITTKTVTNDTNVRPIPNMRKKLQPQVCNGNNKMVPIPYAFAGRCEKQMFAPDDDGIHYSKAKNKEAKKLDRYGPCCYKVTGKSGNNVSFNSTSFPSTFIVPKLTYDQFIKKCTGKRHTFVYRLVYGYTPPGIDNKAANYIYGTKKIEPRSYKGLLSLLKDPKMINKIILYFRTK